MQQRTKEITQYFRSAVAAQSNAGIDFKDSYYIISPEELTSENFSGRMQ
ncbi:MAG: hypothetical protein AAGU12_15050 [Clostridiales bacterium]